MEQLLQFLKIVLFRIQTYEFTVANLFALTGISVLSFFLFWSYRRLSKRFYDRHKVSENNQKAIDRFLKTILYWTTGIALIRSLGLPLPAILSYKIWEFGDKYQFNLSMIVNSILIYVFARTLLWLILQLSGQYFERRQTEPGTRYAISQLIQYVVYTLTTLAIFQSLGFELTVIWGGAAALLVGFGLGMQQTFNDLVSGILMMVEGSVHVGDTVKVKGEIGTVTRIGIRASEIRLRDNVDFIIPNSHLVMDSISNWHHQDNKARFSVSVGVAYGSNTDLVKNVLLDAAKKHSKVLDYPEPLVRFINFGDSALDFELHFWTFQIEQILDIQSDLRFEIDRSFRANKIQIPFPQRDLWIRNSIQMEERQ